MRNITINLTIDAIRLHEIEAKRPIYLSEFKKYINFMMLSEGEAYYIMKTLKIKEL